MKFIVFAARVLSVALERMFKFFKKFSKKVSDSAGGIFRSLLRAPVNENFLKDVENILIAADFGGEIAGEIIGEIRRLLQKRSGLQFVDVVETAVTVVQSALVGSEASLDMDG
ncbi:MAG: signal recognition particle receptor subunit alpha, partial [Puniceicoccales bacterium]|nr:signal recognition particle receptor subunit alpha [Puniceicoccales bacterium]